MRYDLYTSLNHDAVLWKEGEMLSPELQRYMMALSLSKKEGKERKEKMNELLGRDEFKQELISYGQQLYNLGINRQLPEISKLPNGSHIIQITFTLRKPYVSRDDKEFYILDNPVTKDPVFKIPIIRSSSWKGTLRWVTRNMFPRSQAVIERLFGNEKGARLAKRGRLIFYTTFFDQISLDVITPLERVTRTPRRGPILFEIVPVGSQGTFSVLYFPFDLLHLLRQGANIDKIRIVNEIKEDLKTLREAIPAMFMIYGFSAKKTSGYGVSNDVIDFRIGVMEGKNFDEFKKCIDKLIESIGVN